SAVHTFNVAPMRPCSFWQLRSEAVALEQWLQNWVANPGAFPAPTTALAALNPPSIGEVTSRSLKSLHAPGRALSLAFWIVALAFLTSTFLGASTVYVCGVVLLLRLFEPLPVWWSKEPPPPIPKPAVKAVGA